LVEFPGAALACDYEYGEGCNEGVFAHCETARTYGQTLDLLAKNKGIEWLVAEYRNESQRMVSFFPVLFLSTHRFSE